MDAAGFSECVSKGMPLKPIGTTGISSTASLAGCNQLCNAVRHHRARRHLLIAYCHKIRTICNARLLCCGFLVGASLMDVVFGTSSIALGSVFIVVFGD